MANKSNITKANSISDDFIESIKNYGDKIKSIDSFVEGVRRFPGQWIGGSSNVGWKGCGREIFQNAVDECIKKDSPCHYVKVIFDERNQSFLISDTGRGIPHGKIWNIYATERSSSNYEKNPGEYSSGTHGVGSGVAMSLSGYFEVTSYVLGVAHKMIFEEGVSRSGEEEMIVPCPKGRQGTDVFMTPSTILGKVNLKVAEIFDLVASIYPQTNIGDQIDFVGIDAKGDVVCQQSLVNKLGIKTYLATIAKSPLIDPICFGADTGIMKADIVFTYDLGDMNAIETVVSFGNYTPTPLGGFHVTGFIDAVCGFFRNYMNKIYLGERSKTTVVNSDIKCGLKATVLAAHLNPIFAGQFKGMLSNEELHPFVRDLTYKSLEAWSKTHSTEMNKLCKYFKDVADIRTKSDNGKINISKNYNKNLLNGKPKKYIEPSGSKGLELFIVEGDSAAGSARNSRNHVCQGVFPIRGKLPNAFNIKREDFLKNNEVAAIIDLIGGEYGRNFDISKVKWDKVIISCLTGDTPIKMLDGSVATIEQLYQLECQTPGAIYHVYSFDKENNRVVPGRAYNPRIMGYVDELIHITLDNGQVLKCTAEHLWLMRDGTYLPAGLIQPGMSMMPLNTEVGDYSDYYTGYEYVLQPNGKRMLTHRLVYNHYNGTTPIGQHIHHQDVNQYNNDPSNLGLMEAEAHKAFHLQFRSEEMKNKHRLGLYNESNVFKHGYNESQEHRDLVKDLHDQGVYDHTYFSNNGYNESQEHIDRVKELRAQGHYEQTYFRNRGYNQSEQNRESTRQLNKNDDMKKLQWKGKYIKMGATLVRDGYTLTPELLSNGYADLKSKGYLLYSLNTIMEVYNSFDEYVRDVYSNPVSDKDYEYYKARDLAKLSAASKASKITMLAKVGRYMIDNDLPFTEEGYNVGRKAVSPKAPVFYKVLNEYFGNLEEFMAAAKGYNHKAVKVERIKLAQPIPVYDLTVHDYHNFAIADSTIPFRYPGVTESGIFSHNCDADPDGGHIRTLLLRMILMYMPDLILAGKLYATVPPLYGIKNSKGMKYFTTSFDFTRYIQTLFTSKYTLTDVNNNKLSNIEASALFYKNADYAHELEIASNIYAINPTMLETILYTFGQYINIVGNEKVNSIKMADNMSTTDKYLALRENGEGIMNSGGSSMDIQYTIDSRFNYDQFKKTIEKNYRFVTVKMNNGVIMVEGLVDSKYQYVFLNDKFIKGIIRLVAIFQSNTNKYYCINGTKVTMYSLMKTFDDTIPNGLKRFKGLGEQNPEELADSVLLPANRTLIQYTMEDAKREIELIRYIDSDKSSLFNGISLTRKDIE